MLAVAFVAEDLAPVQGMIDQSIVDGAGSRPMSGPYLGYAEEGEKDDMTPVVLPLE